MIIPLARQILLNESYPSSRKMLSFYLKQIIEYILPPFWNPPLERPSWLDSIFIRDEEKLRHQLDDIRSKLEEIEEEKSILADHGHSLSRKVTTILQSLGFHAEYKETTWSEDIEISDGDHLIMNKVMFSIYVYPSQIYHRHVAAPVVSSTSFYSRFYCVYVHFKWDNLVSRKPRVITLRTPSFFFLNKLKPFYFNNEIRACVKDGR